MDVKLHPFKIDEPVANRRFGSVIQKSPTLWQNFCTDQNVTLVIGDIATFSGICHSFWNALIETFPEMQEYVNGDPDSRLYRNRDGGHILFRPIALLPFVKATIRVMDNTGSTFLEALSRFPRFLLSIDNPIWRNVLDRKSVV